MWDSLETLTPRRGFWFPGTGFQLVELGFCIPIVSGIQYSLNCISDSKAQNSRLHKQKFSRIPKTWFPCNTLGDKSDFVPLN